MARWMIAMALLAMVACSMAVDVQEASASTGRELQGGKYDYDDHKHHYRHHDHKRHYFYRKHDDDDHYKKGRKLAGDKGYYDHDDYRHYRHHDHKRHYYYRKHDRYDHDGKKG